MSTTQTNPSPAPTGDGSEASVVLSTRGSVSVVTLNRPDRLNAIDLETHLLLEKTLREADADPETRVIVITGSGRAFCAGGDVKRMEGRSSFGVDHQATVHSPGRHLVDTMGKVEKPMIAMVNGYAVGLGATIALLTDVTIMAEEARIGDRHVNVGLVAGDGGALIWPLLIGTSRAKEFLMTGRMIDGAQAAQMGLVSRAVPLPELEDTVFELAQELADLPPYAVRATKASVNRIVNLVSSVVLETSLAYEHLSMKTADHQEALRARQEKRAGVYTGK